MKRATIASLVLVLSFLFSMFPVSFAQSTNDWPMFQHDPAHTGYAASSTSTGQTPGTLIWNYKAGRSLPSPAVADGVVYAGGGVEFYALNASIGYVIWEYTVGYSSSSAAVADGSVYVCSGNYVYAFNASTGSLKWITTPGGSSPAVANGMVYTGSRALNATDGSLIWSSPIGGSSPTVVDGVVYTGSGDGNVYASNAYTGALIWNYKTGSSVSSPAVVDGVVYTGSGDHNVYVLNANTGALIWSYTTGGSVSSPAVVGGVVYVGSTDHNVYALNALAGALIWSHDVADSIVTCPAVADGIVYVGARYTNTFYALSAIDGTKIWSFYTSGSVSSPAMADGIVYIGSADWRVYAFSAFSSTPIPTPTPSPVPTPAPTPSGSSILYSGFEDGFNGWTKTYGGVSVVSSPIYQGNYAMKCSIGYGSLVAKTIGQQSVASTSAEFYFDNRIHGQTALIAYRNWAGNPTVAMGISWDSKVCVFVEEYLPSYNYSQYVLTNFYPGTWYRFSLIVSSTSATIYVNGNQVANIAQNNIPPTDSVNIGQFWGFASTVNLYVDNVQISSPQT
jgi:outer membrane protein assembly factor BamB